MSEPAAPYRPAKIPTNPGRLQAGKLESLIEGRPVVESVNLLDITVQMHQAAMYRVDRQEQWLTHSESGFQFLPLIVSAQLAPTGGFRTVTTVQVNHPSLIPAGAFEYQHSGGKSLDDAIRKGIESWTSGDLVPLLDSARAEPRHCTRMQMQFPPKGDHPSRDRRVILGPPAHYLANLSKYASAQGQPAGEPGVHDFCPCCLLTNSFETFKQLLESDSFYAIRLFAARDAEGKPMADCRVNGEDFPAGVTALQNYAAKWKETGGYEFRKQYVIFQNTPEQPPIE